MAKHAAVKCRFVAEWPESMQPGDMFFVGHHGGPEKCRDWSNCDDKHLYVVLPNGHLWDVDGRASNCDKKTDREHRCWIRHGDPRTEKVTVDKNGQTCGAGAGSIASDGYHGFLQSGTLTAG